MQSDSRRRPKPVILALAPHSWDTHWLSRQQLLSRLARRGWPVIYASGPLDWWSRNTPEWQRAPWLGRLEPRDAGVLADFPGRWPCLWDRFSAWSRIVTAQHARRLLKAADRLSDRRHLMLFHPRFEPYIELLRPDRVHYHVYDVHRLMGGWSEKQAAMEARLVSRADLITTSSPGMALNLPAPGPEKARQLPNGADAHHFASADRALCPTELASIPHPRIGYVGNINPKLDFEMIETMAQNHPEWHWVFMGPVTLHGQKARDCQTRIAWDRLRQRPNIHFLGLKPRDILPTYLVHMDLHVICYKIARVEEGAHEDWVVHGYPTKLHEYLATGKPVVAAPQTALLEFSDVAAIASTIPEWEQAISAALAGRGVGTPVTRRARALQNTWESRVDLLESWLEQLHPDMA
ncbi:MAG: glycosyltransferase [Magnetococcales bacterium]|nr:glycosyltransferase [Magnetococcales bacterium]